MHVVERLFPLIGTCTSNYIGKIFSPAGGAGEKLLMPGTGFLTVGSASILAFCQILREEYPEVPCKLNQVSLAVSQLPSWT